MNPSSQNMEDTQAHRLSPQQERLWLLQQDNVSGHGQIAILIEGVAR